MDSGSQIIYLIKEASTRMGFEPTRAEPNGLAVHRLNLSATSSGSSWYNTKNSGCHFFDWLLNVVSQLDLALCIVYPAVSSASHNNYVIKSIAERKMNAQPTTMFGDSIYLDQMQWASTNIVINFAIITMSLWRNRLARSAVNRKVGGSSPPRDVVSSVSQISLSQLCVLTS